jgi:hypothetical protein
MKRIINATVDAEYGGLFQIEKYEPTTSYPDAVYQISVADSSHAPAVGARFTLPEMYLILSVLSAALPREQE